MARNVINSHHSVKRKVKKSLLPLAALAFFVMGGARAEGVDDIKRHCDGSPDPEICAEALTTIGADFDAAHAGDYQGQRNLAFCLSNGCAGAVMVDPVAACAWRIIVLASASPSIDSSDAENYGFDCGRIGRTGEARAMVLARAKFRGIYGRKMPEF